MKLVLGALVVLLACTVDPGQGLNPERVLVRDKRTIQFIVNHLSQFFGLSGGPAKAANEKQDSGNPLASILLSSAGKFSGGSGGGGSKKSSTPKPFVAQFEIPSPERLIQEPSETSGPSRVPLLDSEPSSTTTTTTEEPVQEPSTEAPAPASSEDPATDAPPEEAPENPPSTDSEPEPEAPTTIDPAAVNTLANEETSENRDDSSTQPDDSAPQTPSASQQPQQFRRPAWSPFGATSYTNHHQVPFTSYFGNNVFLPAPFIPQPFSHFGQYQQQQIPLAQPIQYHSGHHPNLIPAASATSHSRVKMHDAPFDLVTFHGDSNGAGSSSYYHVRKF